MKKFFLALVAVVVFAIPQFVSAADVPDIRQISSSIRLLNEVVDDELSMRSRQYYCEDDNATATRYFNQYAQMLLDAGFEIIDGEDMGEDLMIWGLVHPDKDVPVVQLKLPTPVHIVIQQEGKLFQVWTALGITYDEE